MRSKRLWNECRKLSEHLQTIARRLKRIDAVLRNLARPEGGRGGARWILGGSDWQWRPFAALSSRWAPPASTKISCNARRVVITTTIVQRGPYKRATNTTSSASLVLRRRKGRALPPGSILAVQKRKINMRPALPSMALASKTAVAPTLDQCRW